MVLGVILAGGRSRRFGTEKGAAVLAGRTLVDWVALRAKSQVGRLIVSARHPVGQGTAAGLPLVADAGPGSEGPLAGILAAMTWARAHQVDCEWVATFPVDSPFFPADHVRRLVAAVAVPRPVIASSGGRDHPVFGLWPLAVSTELSRLFHEEGERKLAVVISRLHAARVTFGVDAYDPYFNINTKDDLRAAEAIARAYFDSAS